MPRWLYASYRVRPQTISLQGQAYFSRELSFSLKWDLALPVLAPHPQLPNLFVRPRPRSSFVVAGLVRPPISEVEVIQTDSQAGSKNSVSSRPPVKEPLDRGFGWGLTWSWRGDQILKVPMYSKVN